MKKFFSIISVFALGLILSCGSAPKTNESAPKTNGNEKVSSSETNPSAAKAGESASSTTTPSRTLEVAPEWLAIGVPNMVCGIGGAMENQDEAEAIKLAKDAARTDFAANLESKIHNELEKYNSEMRDRDNGESQSLAEDGIKISVKETVGMFQPYGLWQSPKGTFFAIMCYDPERFDANLKENIKKNAKIDEGRKQELFKKKENFMKKMEGKPVMSAETAQEAAPYINLPNGTED